MKIRTALAVTAALSLALAGSAQATPPRLSVAAGKAVLVSKAAPNAPTPFYSFDRCHRNTCRLLGFGAPTWTLNECYKPSRESVRCQLGLYKADDPQAVQFLTVTVDRARNGVRTFVSPDRQNPGSPS